MKDYITKDDLDDFEWKILDYLDKIKVGGIT